MERAAAIDIGSNAIRMVIGGLDEHGKLQVYRKLREPVRLGKDVFDKEKTISVDSIAQALKAFDKFKKIIQELKIDLVRSVATSAVREANNGSVFAEIVEKAVGMKVNIIDGIEEARLIQKAIEHELVLNGRCSMFLDIGGGSIETTLAESQKVYFTDSFKLGTVRLLKLVEKEKLSENEIEKLVGDTLQPFTKKVQELKKQNPVEVGIGTGGNVECLGVIRANLFNKSSTSKIYLEELDKIIKKLSQMSYKERMDKWHLREDRADVIYPASLVVKKVMEISGVETLLIPRVGLKDGILLDLLQKKKT